MPENNANIRARATADSMWDPAQPALSLRDVRVAVEDECQKAINWYWWKKRKKSIPSQAVQFSALALTALAGLVPAAWQVMKGFNIGAKIQVDTGPVAAICLGIAAALLALDKAFGYSSGWTRYVLTATNLTKLLHEFRLDWIALVATAGDNPNADQQAKLIQRAKDFVSAVQGMILQETRDWATEFQSNMAQMEKDLKAQLDALKAQVDQTAKDREAAAKAQEEAAKPGSIELTVANADQTDGYEFKVTLEGPTPATDSVAHSKVWARLNVAPGQYKVTIEAKAKGNPVVTSKIFEVKASAPAKPDPITLPI